MLSFCMEVFPGAPYCDASFVCLLWIHVWLGFEFGCVLVCNSGGSIKDGMCRPMPFT